MSFKGQGEGDNLDALCDLYSVRVKGREGVKAGKGYFCTSKTMSLKKNEPETKDKLN